MNKQKKEQLVQIGANMMHGRTIWAIQLIRHTAVQTWEESTNFLPMLYYMIGGRGMAKCPKTSKGRTSQNFPILSSYESSNFASS